jgi:predicted transcriptional regulator
MSNKEKVLQAFKIVGDAVRPGEIAEKTGIDKKEVSQLISELKSEGKVISPKRCFYSIAN